MEKLRFLEILLITITVIENVRGSALCPPLPSIPGIVVSCEVSNENPKKIACLFPVAGVPRRTIAKYKCEEASSFSENGLECRCRGKWKGMAEFQNYTALCGSSANASNFSLNGPSELNMTLEMIHNLTNDTSNNSNVTDFKEDALAYHNFYRKLHGAIPLRLNTTLSAAAQKWTEHEASQDQGIKTEPSSKNRTYISNIFSLTGPKDFDLQKAARLAVGRWYKSSQAYDYDIPVASAFSSMIWNGTTDLGVGVSSKGNQLVLICNYYPPGNVYVVNQSGDNTKTDFDPLALFKQNVFRPVINNTLSDNTSPTTTTTESQ